MSQRRPLFRPLSGARKFRAGFALAPILYVLGLIGVTAGVLFSGYSQVIKSNIAISDSLAIKNDLNGSTQILAGSAKLGTDSTTLCPPNGANPSAVCAGISPTMMTAVPTGTDTHRPTIYSGGSAATLTSGNVLGPAKEAGIFAVGAGMKQLDPWGHYYIYCKWENPVTTGQTSPSILVISAGADGELETSCNAAAAATPVACDLKAGCDDTIYYMNVGTTINHSTLWQAGTKTIGTATVADVTYGVNPLSVDAFGNLAVPGNATIGTSTAGASLLNVGSAGTQLTVDTAGDLAVPGTSQFAGNVTGASGGTLNIGSNLSVAGNITLTPSNSTITGNGGLTLQETGDALGSASLAIENRTGVNGALFSDPSIDLVDFGFLPSSGSQNNIRLEHRSGQLFYSGNTTGEFQFDYVNGGGVTNYLAAGPGATIINSTYTGIGTNNPTAKLDVEGSGGVILNAGNVGIGTSNPITKLEVVGSIGIATTDFTVGTIGTGVLLTTGASVGNTYGALQVYTNGEAGVGNLSLNQFGGNVGVGTSIPANMIEAYGDSVRVASRASTSAGNQIVEAQANDYFSASSFTGTSLHQYGSTASGTTVGLSNARLGTLTFQNGSAGLIYNNGGPIYMGTVAAAAPAFTLLTNGNVGIGTSLPSSALQVVGTITGTVPVADLDSGTNASDTTFWRGDGTWAAPALDVGSSGGVTGVLPIVNGGTGASTATGALDDLFGGDTGTAAATMSLSRLPTQAGLAPGGPYNNITVDAEGIVTSASYAPVACTSPAPNAFSFTNQTGVALNTTITSNTITLAGFTGCTAAATCTNCTNILRNGIPNGTSANFVSGDTIALQMLSSSVANTAVTTTVTVGTTISSVWSVTTGTNTTTAFSFTNQTGVADSATITSNTITLGGTFTNVTATCGPGCIGIYHNNLGPFSVSVSGVSSGDTIAIQQVSSANNNTATTATVTVGLTTSSPWQVTTGTDACAVPSPTIGTVCADGSVYAGTTPDGGAKMFSMPCDVGYSGSANACTGSYNTYQWSAGTSITTGVNSAVTGRANTTLLHSDDSNADKPYAAADTCYNLNYLGHTDWYLPAYNEINSLFNNRSTLGGYAGTDHWSSTEANSGAAYSVQFSGGCCTQNNGKNNSMAVHCVRNSNNSTQGAPDAFSFTNQTNAALGQTIISNTVVLSGPFAQKTVTCGSGCTGISINGGAFTAGPVSGVNSGATLAIEQVASASLNTTTSATVSVGSTTSSAWTVQTATANGCTGSPAVGTVCSDGTVYAGITPDGGGPMYTTPCDVGETFTSGGCSGSAIGLAWSNGTSVTTGVTNGVTGRANTYQLHSDDSNADAPYSAADYCYNLNYLGHNDWYLPGPSELYLMMTNYTQIGGFTTQWHWNSTEANPSSANATLEGGAGQSAPKNWGYNVRCVRNTNSNTNGAPSAFSFTNQGNVSVGQTIVSNTITLAGLFANATVTCGSGCIGISVNGGVFSAGPVTGVNPNNTLAIEQTSSASYSTATTATVSVGTTTSSPWQVTTQTSDACATSPSPGTVCADGSLYVGVTPDGNAKMFVTPCDAGLTSSAGACTGTAIGLQWSAGQSVTTGITNLNTGRENTYTLHSDDGNIDTPYSAADYCYSLNYLGHTDWYLPAENELNLVMNSYSSLGGFAWSWHWSSTETGQTQAYIAFQPFGTGNGPKTGSLAVRCVRNANVISSPGNPGAFSFTNQSGVALGQTITSNSITLTGLFANLTATCQSGCTAMSINGGPFVAGPVANVSSGATIAIQQTASSSAGTTTNATVKVGSTTSSTWQVTTDATDPCAVANPSAGTTCADGTVYAGLTPDGNVKMFAMPCDYGMSYVGGGVCTGNRISLEWSAGTSVTTGITSANTGRLNTLGLHSDDADADGPYQAADYCYGLNYLGHTDWYLPAYNELNILSVNGTVIGNFSGNYWTSTEQYSGNAYYQGLPGGGTGNATVKYNNGLQVRCVRNANSAPPNTPNAFNFTNVTGVNPSAVVTSNTVTLTGTYDGLTATCGSGCTAMSVNGGAFTAGPVYALNTGTTIAIQQTASASTSTLTSATVTVGSTTSSAWTATTASSNRLGYFVITSTSYNGNFGGLSGANAACLTELGTTNTTWLGHSTANSNGQITSAKVKAFLCDSSTCTNLLANATYAFANDATTSYGGNTFTTDGNGLGPNDSANWSGTGYFGVNQTYWTNRGQNTPSQWSISQMNNGSGGTCNSWTTNSSGFSAPNGITGYTNAVRWNTGNGYQYPNNCSESLPIICIVNP